MVENAMNQSDLERENILREIAAANATPRKRLRSEGIEIEYSLEDDYLRVVIGQPRVSEGISREDDLDLVILYDPDTFEVTAIEVPFFKESMAKKALQGEFWQLIATFIEHGGPNIYIPPVDQADKIEAALGRLVVA